MNNVANFDDNFNDFAIEFDEFEEFPPLIHPQEVVGHDTATNHRPMTTKLGQEDNLPGSGIEISAGVDTGMTSSIISGIGIGSTSGTTNTISGGTLDGTLCTTANITNATTNNNNNYVYKEKTQPSSSFSLPDRLDLLSLNLPSYYSNSSESSSPETQQALNHQSLNVPPLSTEDLTNQHPLNNSNHLMTINPQELMGKDDYFLPSSISSPNLSNLGKQFKLDNYVGLFSKDYQPVINGNDINEIFAGNGNSIIDGNINGHIDGVINGNIIGNASDSLHGNTNEMDIGNDIINGNGTGNGIGNGNGNGNGNGIGKGNGVGIGNGNGIGHRINGTLKKGRSLSSTIPRVNLGMNNECINAIKSWIDDSNEEDPTGIFRKNSSSHTESVGNQLPTLLNSNHPHSVSHSYTNTQSRGDLHGPTSTVNATATSNSTSHSRPQSHLRSQSYSNGNTNLYGGIDKRRRRRSSNKDFNDKPLNLSQQSSPDKLNVNREGIKKIEIVEQIPVHNGRVLKNEPIVIPPQEDGKPFNCPNCSKQFKRSEHLKRHIRSVHSNIRPFHCKYCEKQFSRSDNLAQHLKTHYKINENGTTSIIYGNPIIFHKRKKSINDELKSPEQSVDDYNPSSSGTTHFPSEPHVNIPLDDFIE